MNAAPARPIERVVMRLADEGLSSPEIAWRLRRSPRHIDQVMRLAQLPRPAVETAPLAAAGPFAELRPIERCVLNARAGGAQPSEIAARLRRTPGFVERVEGWARYKLSHR